MQLQQQNDQQAIMSIVINYFIRTVFIVYGQYDIVLFFVQLIVSTSSFSSFLNRIELRSCGRLHFYLAHFEL